MSRSVLQSMLQGPIVCHGGNFFHCLFAFFERARLRDDGYSG